MSKVKGLQIILATMQAAGRFHQTFLKTMLMSLKLGGVSSNKMSYQERKRAIKHSANIAMAVTSNGTNWGRALIIRHAKHEKNRILLRSLLGRKRYESITNPCFTWNFLRQRNIIKRSLGMTSRLRRGVHASSEATASVMAKSLVKKRARILKRLVPGGESMDDFSILGETMDYVISLQAQVNLMRLLTEVLGGSNLSPRT